MEYCVSGVICGFVAVSNVRFNLMLRSLDEPGLRLIRKSFGWHNSVFEVKLKLNAALVGA